MTKWQKALTKRQREHCRAMGITSLKIARDTFRAQDERREQYGFLACAECFDIKHRLHRAGFDV